MTDREWFARAAAEAGPLPCNYLVIDIETTGAGEHDLPVQIGWALVYDGKPAHIDAQMLDWSDYQTERFIRERLQYTGDQIFRRDGVRYPFTYELLKSAGRPYEEVLDSFLDLYAEAQRGRLPVVCHNGLRFDVIHLDRACRRHLGRGFEPDRYLDTMALERALQTRASVLAGESWDALCRRTYHSGGNKVKSSLVGHCSAKYQLSADLSRAHQADFDCQLTHRLVEAYRDLCPGHLKGLPQ